jgi:hypothetical protein
MRLHSDTSANARAVQDQILRKLSPGERLQMVRDLTVGLQELAFAAIRQERPQLTDEEIWLELASRRLGVDVVRKIYGSGKRGA